MFSHALSLFIFVQIADTPGSVLCYDADADATTPPWPSLELKPAPPHVIERCQTAPAIKFEPRGTRVTPMPSMPPGKYLPLHFSSIYTSDVPDFHMYRSSIFYM